MAGLASRREVSSNGCGQRVVSPPFRDLAHGDLRHIFRTPLVTRATAKHRITLPPALPDGTKRGPLSIFSHEAAPFSGEDDRALAHVAPWLERPVRDRLTSSSGMAKALPSTSRIALALLAGARGEALSAPALIGAAELLGASDNAMRIALSRLCSSGDVQSERRGWYALSRERLAAIRHVHAFRTGFAERVPWQGGFCAVISSHLLRRQAALVRRRESALALTGFREYRPGLHVRPDNLAGGRVVLAAQLQRLGLDPEADVIGVVLESAQLRELERLYDVAADEARAQALHDRVEALLATSASRSPRKLAVDTFWLGDEVLHFLARDPLLPESLADPAPRRALAHAMSRLDDAAYQLWRTLLAQFESTSAAL